MSEGLIVDESGGRSMTEADLVALYRAGDEDAFQQLFEPYAPLLRRRAARGLAPAILRKVSMADLVQETRIVAFERRADFEDRGPG
jgi:DNA-directed RNA polymerase specialized sigma24 family protein